MQKHSKLAVLYEIICARRWRLALNWNSNYQISLLW